MNRCLIALVIIVQMMFAASVQAQTPPTCVHVVQAGETLTTIAAGYRINLGSLIAANPQLRNPNLIHRGLIIQVPDCSRYEPNRRIGTPSVLLPYRSVGYDAKTCIHIVRRGEHLQQIARLYGVNIIRLINANPHIRNPHLIHSGLTVYIPDCTPQAAVPAPAEPPQEPPPQPPATTEIQPDFDLSAVLRLEQLPFELTYPAGWVTFIDGQNVTIAGTQNALNLELDGDNATIPSIPTITLNAIPLVQLNADGTTSITEILEQITTIGTVRGSFETSILARRTIVIASTTSDGRSGIAAIWKQEDVVWILTLHTPDEAAINALAFDWGRILASIQPRLGEDLAIPVTVPSTNITFQVPANWQTPAQRLPFSVNDPNTGASLSAFEAPLPDVAADTATTLQGLAIEIEQLVGITNLIERGEYIILDAPAIGLVGQLEDGTWRRIVFLIQNDQLLFFILSVPNEVALFNAEPIWTAILESIQTAP